LTTKPYPGSGAPSKTEFFDLPGPFEMRSGDRLARVRLAYELYGELNHAKDNLVLVFHALTGSQHAAGFTESVEGVGRWSEENQTGWWEGFVGPGMAFDTDRFAVLCVNYLGGCYGTTGPPSINDDTGRRYGPETEWTQ
jgi:homoserine O-acetyltransferase